MTAMATPERGRAHKLHRMARVLCQFRVPRDSTGHSKSCVPESCSGTSFCLAFFQLGFPWRLLFWRLLARLDSACFWCFLASMGFPNTKKGGPFREVPYLGDAGRTLAATSHLELREKGATEMRLAQKQNSYLLKNPRAPPCTYPFLRDSIIPESGIWIGSQDVGSLNKKGGATTTRTHGLFPSNLQKEPAVSKTWLCTPGQAKAN